MRRTASLLATTALVAGMGLAAPVTAEVAVTAGAQAAEPRARDLRLGREARGSLDGRDATDDEGRPYEPWRLRLAAGQSVAISLSSDAFDARVQIGRGTGEAYEVLGENDDGPDGTDSRLIFTAPEAGDYLVRASVFAEGEGDYTLNVEDAPPPPPAEPITIGQTVEGELGDDDAVDENSVRHDAYRITLGEGQRIAVTLRSGDFDSFLSARPAGSTDASRVIEDDDGLGEGLHSRLTITAASAGDWIIHARGLSSSTAGAYRLSVEEIAPDPVPTPSTLGQGVIEGEIGEGDATGDGGRRFDAYAITGVEGRRMRAIMRSGDFDAYLELGSEGETFTPLMSDDDGLGEGTDSRLDFTFPDNGTYILRASPLSSGEEGLYSLELLDRGLPPEPGSILVGATVRGALDEDSATNDMGAPYDDYAVTLEAGQKLRLTMVSNAFDAFLALAKAEEAEGIIFSPLASDDDGLSDTHSKIDITIEDAGDYVIRAASLAPGGEGDYVLTVEARD